MDSSPNALDVSHPLRLQLILSLVLSILKGFNKKSHKVMIAAGTDTSTGTMEWALSLLLNNPEALKRAHDEIDSQTGHYRLIEDSDLSDLPYLHGIINETLRMFPAAALIPPHKSSEECTIGGFHIPRGAMLLVNLWAIHNNPKLVEEPTMFKPDRFLNLEGQRDGFKFMPFGSGRRSVLVKV